MPVIVGMFRLNLKLIVCFYKYVHISGFFSQSLDYDPCENHLLQDEERKKGYKFIVKKNFARWFIFLLIGICTALIASVVDISIEELTHQKYGYLKFCILSYNCTNIKEINTKFSTIVPYSRY